jgi:hypothetical protein
LTDVWDELDEPLGFVGAASVPLPAGRKRPTRAAAKGAAILAIATVLFMLPRRDFPVNGEPFAVAKVEVLPAPRKIDAPDVTASVRQTAPPPAASAPQAEATGSVKVTDGSGGVSKALIIDVAQALSVKPAPSPEQRRTIGAMGQ